MLVQIHKVTSKVNADYYVPGGVDRRLNTSVLMKTDSHGQYGRLQLKIQMLNIR